jgi:hypothetical protein
MFKKLLIILPFVFLFESILYLAQDLQIRQLDKKAELTQMSKRRAIVPAQSFGDLLAQQNFFQPDVLGETTENVPEDSESTKPKKESYVIAAIGDSMVETMGDSLDYLKASLKEKYPDTEFAMYNYGIGAEKVTSGLERFDKPLNHGTRNYAPLTELKPDVLIVGSYAYNPFDIYSRDGHWLALAGLVLKAKNVTPNVYMLAEIAPLESGFGKGPGGVNWPDEIVKEHVPKIIEQMENAIGISEILGIQLVNVYEKTTKEGSKYGKVEFVSSHDNIHPSVYGQVFTAELVAEEIHLD